MCACACVAVCMSMNSISHERSCEIRGSVVALRGAGGAE